MRFPDFNDEWTQTTLGEILDYEQPTLYIVNNTDYSNDNSLIPVLTANKSFVLGYVNEENIYDKGECIILDDFTLDIKFVDFPFKIKSSAIKILTAKKGVNIKTIYNYLLFKNLRGQEKDHKRHYISEVQPLSISLPSLAEQKKIADFLSLIDERIQSCSEAIKELKTQKAGLLSLLIYRTDKQYLPLSYFGEMKHGYPFKSTNYDENGTYRIVTISNVSGDRYTDMSKCNCLIELPHDIQPHQILSHNDILISLTGNVGRVSLCLADGNLLNQRVGIFSLYNEAHREYIYQVLSDKKFEMSMIACGQGAAQLNISKSNVEGYLVPYEQSDYQKIADFLSLIDERIEVEELLLKKYEEQKKYLLRNMFV